VDVGCVCVLFVCAACGINIVCVVVVFRQALKIADFGLSNILKVCVCVCICVCVLCLRVCGCGGALCDVAPPATAVFVCLIHHAPHHTNNSPSSSYVF